MSDVFDEVFALLTPQRLLQDPRASGEGVAVAIIDTGIDRERLAQKHKPARPPLPPIQGGIFTAASPAPLPYEGKHSSPHGTTVADIVLTIAPRVRLYSADVFGPQGTSEVEAVIHALRWAMDEWRCKIINISVGVAEHRLQQWPRR